MNAGTVAAFLVQRVGPYHHARLQAWAACRPGGVHAIEFRPTDTIYAWSPVQAVGRYGRRRTRSAAELCRALNELQPAVVVCVGYADTEIHCAMQWALTRGIPLVTCSDSTFADEPRTWLKEKLKRAVLAAFDAGLVAGRRAREYLGQLGLQENQLFHPWDVVDNEHFERGARAAQTHAPEAREKLGVPERFFICVARFVPKKNLAHLLEAYARYRKSAGREVWALVLSGAGPLEDELRQLARRLAIEADVIFPGFVQYSDLPVFYGLAGALVLPSVVDQWGLVVNEAMAAGLPVLVSSRCGCVPELVREGHNGFVFDPAELFQLACQLNAVATMDPFARATMGRRSQEIVAEFSPAAFAQGIEAAVAGAHAKRRKAPPWVTRIVIDLLVWKARLRS